MDLTQLANLGEFIGGVAVLVTLVYLVIQLRQNNVNIRAAARQSLLENWSDIQLDLGHHQDLLGLIGEGIADFEGLSDAEKTQFVYLMAKYSANVYNGVLLHEQGVLDQDTLDYIGGLLAMATLETGGAAWFAGFPQPAKLARFFDDYRERMGDVPPLGEVMPYFVTRRPTAPGRRL